MIYIGHKINIYFFLELEEALNSEDNIIVESWEDLMINPLAWLKLNEDQELFYKNNPNANAEEVVKMELFLKSSLEPDLTLIARQQKLLEIQEQDFLSNKFFVSVISNGNEIENFEMTWLDKDLRNSLLNITLPSLLYAGITTKKFWTNTTPSKCIEAPISWVQDNLPLLEIYATRTWDIMKANEAAVYAATNIQEIKAIDVKTGYPLFLTFELNLDLYESNNSETIN